MDPQRLLPGNVQWQAVMQLQDGSFESMLTHGAWVARTLGNMGWGVCENGGWLKKLPSLLGTYS
jgi:hypothetical protein